MKDLIETALSIVEGKVTDAQLKKLVGKRINFQGKDAKPVHKDLELQYDEEGTEDEYMMHYFVVTDFQHFPFAPEQVMSIKGKTIRVIDEVE